MNERLSNAERADRILEAIERQRRQGAGLSPDGLVQLALVYAVRDLADKIELIERAMP